LASRQGFGELKTEQLGGHSQEQQRHRQALIDDDDDIDIANMSVCPSVRNVPISDENGLTYRHSFSTIR